MTSTTEKPNPGPRRRQASTIDIPRLSNLEVKKGIDVDLLNQLSALTAKILQENPKPLTGSVILRVSDLERLLGKQLSSEITELLVLRISRSGWKVYLHYEHGYLDTIVINSNLKDTGI